MQTRFQLEGIKSEIANRWSVFRDSAINFFILAHFDQRVTELVRSLENIAPDQLQRVQGQISEARKCRDFIAKSNQEVALQELIAKLK